MTDISTLRKLLPKDVRVVPDDRLAAFLLDHWRGTLLRPGGADDQMMVFGAKTRARDPAIVVGALRTFIQDHTESAATGIAAWFLAGWATRERPTPLEFSRELLDRIDAARADPLVLEPVVFVLAVAMRGELPDELRGRIKSALKAIHGDPAIRPEQAWVAEPLDQALMESAMRPSPG